MTARKTREALIRAQGREWLAPDAPMDYETGRKCHWCGERVMRYTKPQCKKGPLLCSRCVEDFDPVAYRAGTQRARREQRKRSGKPDGRVKGMPLYNLKTLRKEQGKSQAWVDTALNVRVGYTSKIERGILCASPEKAQKLAAALNVTVEDLRGQPEFKAAS